MPAFLRHATSLSRPLYFGRSDPALLSNGDLWYRVIGSSPVSCLHRAGRRLHHRVVLRHRVGRVLHQVGRVLLRQDFLDRVARHHYQQVHFLLGRQEGPD